MDFKYLHKAEKQSSLETKKVKKRTKEVAPYPKVQCEYEGLMQSMFSIQLNETYIDLVKEMTQMKKK